jgi:LysM repeat protein
VAYLRNTLYLLLLIAVAGCNLNTSAPATEAVVLPTRPVVIATEEANSNNPPTKQPQSTNTTTSCTPRADWTVIYTIVSGDTLFDVATRSNTTAQAVAQGNCLSDPNAISAGQQIRLPQTPTSNNLPPVQTYVTYTNDLPGLGIALEFPANWSVSDNPNDLILQGSNGSAFEILYGNPGATTSPEQDAALCKTLGACIGSRSVIREYSLTLPSGLTGYRLDLSAGTNSGSTPMSETFMVVNNRNLAVRGFGDLTIYDTILNSIRVYMTLP